METKIVPISKEDCESVEVLFFRYQAFVDILNFLAQNNALENNLEVFNQKWEEAVELYHKLEMEKQRVDEKYHPEGNWTNYTFNFLNERLEYTHE